MATRRTSNIGIAAIIAVLLATLGVVGSGATSASASSSEVQAMAPDTYESQVLYWVNRERAKRGLAKVRMHGCTDSFSERWSQHLVDTDSFYHQDLRPILRKCGARYASETLGTGSVDPRGVVTMWMNSSAHRKLLLSPKPRRFGVGAVLDADGRWMVTANFTRL